MEQYLRKTALLDYDDPSVRQLIRSRGWDKLNEFSRIGAAYNFVRDEILFGYNTGDALPASAVLADGFGQCNTKATLFMALLRALGIPCRIHGFTIRKTLQKGAMTGIVYRNAPEDILHSWAEVLYQGKWIELEGIILDRTYLENLQRLHADCSGPFCGYGVAVKDLQHPSVDWNGNGTRIQSEGIHLDFGIYDSPDELFAAHRQEMSPVREFAYRHIGRRLMNRNVKKIRGSGP